MRHVLLAALLVASVAEAKKNRSGACAADEHASAGHCCQRGEEWVPAKGRCLCLDPPCAPPRPVAKAPAPAKPSGAETAAVVLGALADVLELENLARQMAAMPSDYQRVTQVQSLVEAPRRFTCAQIRRLMDTATTDWGRV